MDFYSNSKPDLVGPMVKKSVYKIMKKEIDNNTISDRISKLLTDFYKDYIKEYKLIVFLIIIFVVFLLYRYYNKEEKEEVKEKFTKEEQKIIDEIFNSQTKHLTYDSQPSFNRLESVNGQQEYVNYPPDPIPINIPDQGIKYTKSLYDYSKQFDNLNNPDYDYNNVYEYPSRSYYTGTYNTYQDAEDTDIVNPYGWSNEFNTNAGKFVSSMTDANRQNIVDYQTIVDNMNGDLQDSLKIGPKYLDETLAPEMDPPYADDF